MATRDSQRSKVYVAEHAIDKVGGGARLETVPEIQAWINKLTKYRWFIRRWGKRTIIVEDGRGKRWARGGGSRIWLPRWARTKTVILHELAHCLSSSWNGGSHGWQFCMNFRLLVRFAISKEAEQVLVQSFKASRVRYKKPRKQRMLTADERFQLAARMKVTRLLKTL